MIFKLGSGWKVSRTSKNSNFYSVPDRDILVRMRMRIRIVGSVPLCLWEAQNIRIRIRNTEFPFNKIVTT